MELLVGEKFKNAVQKVLKERKIKKKDIGFSIGYNTPAAFSNVLNGNRKIKMENLIKFCDLYGFELSDFLPEIQATPSNKPSLISEQNTVYGSDTMKGRILQNQFLVMEKTNNMMKQLYLSGVELSDSQNINMKNLKNLIGI